MPVPNTAGILHDRPNQCGVVLGPTVSWASSHVSLEKCTCWICFAGCAVDVLLPAKLIVQLHAYVFDAVCSFQDMIMDSVVLLNDIAFVDDSQWLTLEIFPPSIVGC